MSELLLAAPRCHSLQRPRDTKSIALEHRPSAWWQEHYYSIASNSLKASCDARRRALRSPAGGLPTKPTSFGLWSLLRRTIGRSWKHLCLPTASCAPCSPSQLAEPACNNVWFTGHFSF